MKQAQKAKKQDYLNFITPFPQGGYVNFRQKP